MSTIFSKSKMFILALVVSMSMFATSCGNGNGVGGSSLQIPGVNGPTINLVGMDVVISMTITAFTIDIGGSYYIPNFPNSSIEVSPSESGSGTLVSVSVNLNDILGNNIQNLSEMTLPGGRPLPSVAAGQLPASAFTIPAWDNVVVYLGPTVFGVFIPVPGMIQGAIVTASYKVSGTTLGTLSLVGSDSNKQNGGFLLLINITNTLKNDLAAIGK